MRIEAPFTVEQVKRLNAFQQHDACHSFTCPAAHEEGRELVATKAGWICPHCEYRQDWAHDFMADGSYIEQTKMALTALTQQPADHIPDASNMVPAEQIADGALGVTQADKDAAARLNGYASWRVWEAAPQHDEEWMLLCANDLTRHAQQARAQALEEAAKVAEAHDTFDRDTAISARQAATAVEIASAIRALQPHGQGGGE